MTRTIAISNQAAACCWLVALMVLSIGCKTAAIPPGTQLQASSIGIDIAPQGVGGPHVTFGSKAVTVVTAQPDNAPNLNRLAVKAPGIDLRSTVATGDVGEQLQKAGGPESIKALLHSPDGSAVPPNKTAQPVD